MVKKKNVDISELKLKSKQTHCKFLVEWKEDGKPQYQLVEFHKFNRGWKLEHDGSAFFSKFVLEECVHILKGLDGGK